MCDCFSSKCIEDECSAFLPVHIGDFCVPRDRIEARCKEHPPEDPEGWWAFDGCRDEDEPAWTMYLRYVGSQEELDGATADNRTWLRSHGLGDLAGQGPGYHIGLTETGQRGDICPNVGEYTERRVTESFDGKG